MIEDDPKEWVVSIFCQTNDPSAVARAAELLGRAVAGLALEGISCSLHVGPSETDGEDS